MQDTTGTTSYVYDALSRLLSVTDPGSNVVQYGYDPAGNRTQILYPQGARPVTYAYDAANRLTSMTDWQQQQFSFAYDSANRLTSVTYPSSTGIIHWLAYDAANRLTSQLYQQNGSTNLIWESFTLDADGNRTTKQLSGTDMPSSVVGTETDTLDVLNRLTRAAYPNGTTTSYAYDAVGNRTSMTTAAGTTTYAYDNADQLTTVTPPGQAAQSYNYDANGSITSKGTGTSFAWNALGQLTSATQNGVTQSSTYTGDGLRLSRTVGSATSYFVYDLGAKLPVVLDDGGSQYLYGVGGLLSRVLNGQPYYYLTDALGSTLAIVNGSGSLQQDYVYDVYGTVIRQDGSLGSEFQFTGQQTDATGLQYLRARYYDPSTGRFLSRDPLPKCVADPASHHLYAFANEAPTNAIDPSGLCTIEVRGKQLTPPIGIGGHNVVDAQYHLYIILTNPDGSQTVCRGGPSNNGPSGSSTSTGSGSSGSSGASSDSGSHSSSEKHAPGLFGNLQAGCGPYVKGTPDYSTDTSRPSVTVHQDDQPCDSYTQSFQATADYINSLKVPYHVLGPNSNSVVWAMLAGAGLPLEKPDVDAPGWGLQ
jgi:RHS repeat-associated protein